MAGVLNFKLQFDEDSNTRVVHKPTFDDVSM
jgi:hypothetical protein